MIELGDILKEMGNQGWVGLATDTSIEEVRLTKFEKGMYEGRFECDTYTQDDLRDLIRNGYVQKVGNVRSAQEGAVRLQFAADEEYAMDAERTESVYEAVESDEKPDSFREDTLFWNAHDHEIISIDTPGWDDPDLADDLIRLDSGGVESVSTVAQAMREGLWILMSPYEAKVEA